MKAVALGGGHGTSVALQALTRFASDVVGIVSVADNGGSSGKLRTLFDIPAVGDIRRCLSATADPSNPLTKLLEQRIGPDLHPLGNLLLASAILEHHDVERAIATVSRMVGSGVTLIPATSADVELVGDVRNGSVRGQTAVHARSDISKIALEPPHVAAPQLACAALAHADLIVAGPGSLYTSVLATLIAPGIAQAIRESAGLFVFLVNLRPEFPETASLTLEQQLEILHSYGIFPDVVVCDDTQPPVQRGDTRPVFASISTQSGDAHDPDKVAQVLQGLVAN